jgi:23S rRNA A2030 N6-methylase RlmJ
MEEERAAEQKRLREEELKEANRLQMQMKIEEEKDRIDRLELEAQNLELIEQELLQKLQSTQMMEKDAFAELEKAMIASSENRRHKLEAT